MLVKLDNPALLVKAVDVISELVTEVRIKVNEEGISITAMDPANVCMVGFVLPKTSFSQFETEQETLGVNLDSLKRILKRCGSGSSLILERKENNLKIQIQDRIRRNFTLNLIDIEKEDKQMPQLEFSARIRLNSVDLIDSIEDCAVVSDACSFIVENGNFVIESRGLNSARSEFSGDEAEIQTKEETDDSGEQIQKWKSRYSLEYLQKFTKAAKMAEKIVLQFSSEHPLKVDVRAEGMELSFILAPRVETND